MTIKLKLTDEFLPSATVYGLICDLPDHRLCYQLNQALNLRLARLEEDKLQVFRHQKLLYPEFTCYDPYFQTQWWLTANTAGYYYPEEEVSTRAEKTSVALVRSLKTINYFLWYEDEAQESIDQWLWQQVKPLRYIRSLQPLPQGEHPGLKNLIVQ